MDSTPTPQPSGPTPESSQQSAGTPVTAPPVAAPLYVSAPAWWPGPTPWGWGESWWTPTRPNPKVDPEKAWKPGLAFYAASVLAVVVGLLGSSLPGQSYTAGVWLGGAVLAFVWFVAFGISAADTRLELPRRIWARWAGIPIMGVLFVSMAASNLPADLRFSASQSQLDAAVASARDGRTPTAGWIGLIPVGAIRVYSDGVVSVEVDRSGCGFANVPQGRVSIAAEGEGWLDRQLTDTWWTWCSDFYSD